MKRAALKPFFKFYGGKWRASHLYPAPLDDAPLIEPFCGSAGYALHYPQREVQLYDRDPIIVAVWDYLIRVSLDEILGLPDLDVGEDVRGTRLSQEAQWLIGFWLNSGSAQPKRSMSRGALIPRARPSYWGPHARERIASQLPAIRHWTVKQADYWEAPDIRATWFIDPPYDNPAGKHYRFHDVDYLSLGGWVRSRRGMAICCEAQESTWLPFTPLSDTQSFTKGRSPEAVFIQTEENPDDA